MLSKVKVVNDKFFFTGQATLYIRRSTRDPATKISSLREVETSSFRCRLSFKESSTVSDLGAMSSKKELLLFTPPLIEIAEGSKIVVVQDNVTHELKLSEIPSIYQTHREYKVEEWEKWQ
ncbi:hypothetical protein [Filifactor villosus]|uniref:Uncharacterized protein n=1 Tax=Filifactor villosus TaxID=29374 RepID=A0ABV9QMI8_9FIRM